MRRKIAIAISGGIDSLVSAFLLKKQGHDVFGIHFTTGFEKGLISHHRRQDKGRFSPLADRLDMPIHIIDCKNEFKANVVDYFIAAYLSGKTPNPCMVCNSAIKFGTVLDHASKLGADFLATGHYARIAEDGKNVFRLLKGIDTAKDQSYFLSFLTHSQLSRAVFPLGDMTKTEVKDFAKQHSLVPASKIESQDICFIKDKTYGEFLVDRHEFSPAPGPVEDTLGNKIGEHKGLHLFTVGQRRGINIPAAEPYYVVSIDMARNLLVVGFKNDLLSSECRVRDINWMTNRSHAHTDISVKVRYRHEAVPATVLSMDDNTAVVCFKTPQSAITPGQAAVFYDHDIVLGGGWIEK